MKHGGDNPIQTLNEWEEDRAKGALSSVIPDAYRIARLIVQGKYNVDAIRRVECVEVFPVSGKKWRVKHNEEKIVDMPSRKYAELLADAIISDCIAGEMFDQINRYALAHTGYFLEAVF